MKRRMFLLGALVTAALISGCNRPEGGWRNNAQDQAEPTQSGSVLLPEVEMDSTDEGDELLDQLDGLLEELDNSLGSENNWQLDVPQENEVEIEDKVNTIAVDGLLSQLESVLGTLDSGLASESSQQIDPP